MNYYNDSLVNDPDFIQDINTGGVEDEKKETAAGVEEEIQIKKKEEKKPEEQEKSEKKEEKVENGENGENAINENNEEKTIKVLYKDGNNANIDKTSYCHPVFYNGVDIDINTKKIIECYENVNTRNFLFFKKKTKIKTLVFFEEQYLYLLKDIVVNKNNENLRRISNRFDLNKLFDYNTTQENKNYLFTFDFIKNDNLLERNIKTLLFTEDDGERFENMLIDVLENYECTFLDEIFEDDNEGEEEEEDEKEDGQENDNNNENENEENKNDEENKKKDFKRISLEDAKEVDLKKSSSREIL